MKRILIVKTTSMGDVIHALPVVQDLRQVYPDVRVDWLVEESFADIPRLHTQVNQVFQVAVRRWRKHWWRWQTWREIRAVKHALAAQRYDVILDLQGLVKSAVMARWAIGPRHGYAADSIREPFASRLYTHTHQVAYRQHAVLRMRQLAAQACGYALPVSPPEYGLVAGRASTPVAAFAALHATSRDSKLWPETAWVALGQALAQRGIAMWLPWATTTEYARACSIAQQVPQALVLPKLSLQQLATQLQPLRFVVGVDTGLSHLATALRIPVVALYLDTNPAFTGVYGGDLTPAINLGGKYQSPTVEEVLAALQRLMP